MILMHFIIGLSKTVAMDRYSVYDTLGLVFHAAFPSRKVVQLIPAVYLCYLSLEENRWIDPNFYINRRLHLGLFLCLGDADVSFGTQSPTDFVVIDHEILINRIWRIHSYVFYRFEFVLFDIELE